MQYSHIINILETVGKKEIIMDKKTCILIGVISFIIFTSLGAFIYIPLPFTPVPITCQTFFVLLSGAILGKRWGPISQLSYVLLGTIGLPVFVGGGGGVGHLLSPTGGYLIGFIFSSWVVGNLISLKKRINITWISFSFIVGAFIYFLCGVVYLKIITNIDFNQALKLGALPFIPGDTIKLFFAIVIFKKINYRTRKIFS